MMIEKFGLLGGNDTPVDESTSSKTDLSPGISVNNLRKTYGSKEDAVRAVDGVSFDVEPGTAVGLLGPNGAGKTTTIKMLLSLIFPSEGNIHVGDINVHKDPKATFHHVGAMLEGARNTYWRLTVRENLEIFSVIAGFDYRERQDRIDELLEQFSLADKADTVVRELSRGQKQKVSLATTMARDADVVVLDEPTLGLDVETSRELRRELRSTVEDEGVTVLLCSHDMDVIQAVCDRVIIMNDGRIVADDTVDNLLELFNTQTYEITVEGDLTESNQRHLEMTFGAKTFDSTDDQAIFRVPVTGDDIYDLTDTLRAYDATINSIETVEADLEEVFLHVTEESPSEQLAETDQADPVPMLQDKGDRR